MKQFLLLGVCAAVSLSLSAQSLNVEQTDVVNAGELLNIDRQCTTLHTEGFDEPTQRPSRTRSTGFYYRKPQGSFYLSMSMKADLHPQTRVMVPSWMETKWENAGLVAPAKWYGKDIQGGRYDYSAFVRDNVMTLSCNANKVAPAPVIYDGAQEEWDIAEKNMYYHGYMNSQGIYVISPNPSYVPIVSATDTALNLAFIDDKADFYSSGQLDGDENSDCYLIGTGKLNSKYFGLGTCVSFKQSYPKPITPLEVFSFFTYGRSNNTTVIPDDKFLTMTITNDLTGEVAYVLQGDLAWLNPNGRVHKYSTTGMFYEATVEFRNYFVASGIPMIQPMYIDYPFTVKVSGFDQEGVNFGFFGSDVNSSDLEWYDEHSTTFQVEYPTAEGIITGNHGYGEPGTPIIVWLSMNARMEYIQVKEYAYASATEATPSYTMLNMQLLNDNGTAHRSLGEKSGSITWIPVLTGRDWYEADGTENYYFVDEDGNDGLPSWITNVRIGAGSNEIGDNQLTFTATPLPAGVNGRYAKIYVASEATTCPTPICLFQGDYKDALASIDAVKALPQVQQADCFNLYGQRVSAHQKGLMIQDGKIISKQ